MLTTVFCLVNFELHHQLVKVIPDSLVGANQFRVVVEEEGIMPIVDCGLWISDWSGQPATANCQLTMSWQTSRIPEMK